MQLYCDVPILCTVSSLLGVLGRLWILQNIFFVSAVKFYLLSKSVINEIYFDKYKKLKNVRQSPCCVGSLLQYSLKLKNIIV